MGHDNHRSFSSDARGFTLIELMISLVLGLLISAAVMQVYLINTRTLTVQQSASEVQDSTIFALQSLDDHIRITNLGNPISNITDGTANGGIVLTASNVANITAIKASYMTISAGQTVTTATKGWTGVSNTNVASDQLTIQYKNITPASLYDCEGAEVVSGSSDWVIERYFVRTVTGDGPTGSGTQDLVLACDAGRIQGSSTVTGFGDNGEIIVPAVEQFQVLLGTLASFDRLTYLPAKTYLEITDKPAITSIKLGVIVRSSTPLIADADKTQFSVFGKSQTLKTDSTNKKYYRRSYESTILLRNARVMSVTGLPSNIQ
ncbi:MAG: PilW family protein [Psychrobacter sp.]